MGGTVRCAPNSGAMRFAEPGERMIHANPATG